MRYRGIAGVFVSKFRDSQSSRGHSCGIKHRELTCLYYDSWDSGASRRNTCSTLRDITASFPDDSNMDGVEPPESFLISSNQIKGIEGNQNCVPCCIRRRLLGASRDIGSLVLRILHRSGWFLRWWENCRPFIYESNGAFIRCYNRCYLLEVVFARIFLIGEVLGLFVRTRAPNHRLLRGM